MYKVNIYTGKQPDSNNYLLRSETIYTNNISVKKAQLWVNGVVDENGVLTRYNLFKIYYANGHCIDVAWKNYDPIYLRSEICISFDGKYLYIPDYDRGVFVVDIQSGIVISRYNIKHVISMLITGSSLLCMHREYKRELVRIDLKKNQKVESCRAIGSYLVPLTEQCIIFKKNESNYIVADADNLERSIKVSSYDLIGSSDERFNIYQASYCSGYIDAAYYISDTENPRSIIRNHQRLLCPEGVRRFLEDIS